jgi:hypothetical protein
MESELRVWRSPLVVRIAVTMGTFGCLLASAQTKGVVPQRSANRSPGQISGHVYRADTGDPLAKAVVTLYGKDEQSADAAGNGRAARTGPDGAFTFSEVPPGTYVVNVERAGFVSKYGGSEMYPRRMQLSLSPGQKLDKIDIRLTPAGVISGSVCDEDNEPVAGIEVSALSINFLPGGRREVFSEQREPTDDLGNFRLAGLQPGAYYVRTGGWYGPALKKGPGQGLRYRQTYYPGTGLLDDAAPVQVGPGGETPGIRIQVTPESTYSISGMVARAGGGAGPKPSDVLIAEDSSVEEMSRRGGATIRPDGSFTIRGLPPGEYTLTARAANVGREVDAGFATVRVFDADVSANIEIGSAAEVRGKAVLEDPQGSSFAGLKIILETRGRAIFPSPFDSSGRFNIRNIPPGQYTFSLVGGKHEQDLVYLKQVQCSGRDYATQPLALDLGTVLNDCMVTLADDTGAITGQATDGDKPASGLVVVLIPESRTLRRIPRYTLTGKTDRAGRYQIEGVVPGGYFLFAVPPDERHGYFALDFADHNRRDSERVSVKPHDTQVVNLKPSTAP